MEREYGEWGSDGLMDFDGILVDDVGIICGWEGTRRVWDVDLDMEAIEMRLEKGAFDLFHGFFIIDFQLRKCIRLL